MSTRTLLRGGTVITAVRPGEVLTDTDILIGADGTIEAIGHGLDAADAEVIDVHGRIVHPGFVDTHRHTWQSVVRNLASDWSLTEYLAGLHTGLSKHFRPEDTYTGNYLGALRLSTPASRRSSTGRTTSRPPSTPMPPSPPSRTRDARRLRPRRRCRAVGEPPRPTSTPPTPDACATSTSPRRAASSRWPSRCAVRSSSPPR